MTFERKIFLYFFFSLKNIFKSLMKYGKKILGFVTDDENVI